MPLGMKEIVLSPVKMRCKRDCPDRALGCHGKCKTYAEDRAKCDEAIRRRELKRDVDNAVEDAMKRMPGKRGI